jgi:outer membrane biogenesis lipoprotein LolB
MVKVRIIILVLVAAVLAGCMQPGKHPLREDDFKTHLRHTNPVPGFMP